MLTHIACKLRHTNFLLQIALETPKENFTLTRFETIHQMRQRANIVGIAEVNEFIVNKSGIENGAIFRRNECTLGVIGSQPAFAIIGALLVKGKTNGLIRLFIPFVFEFVKLFKPLTCFCRRARAQAFVIFECPSFDSLFTQRCLPRIKLLC